MKNITIYDPAMCCASGVCGPEVDPKLVQFAADLKWLQERGVTVARHSLSQNPAAFVENEAVKAALSAKGEAALPLVFADEQVLASGTYPTRSELAQAAGLAETVPSFFTPAVAELIAIGAAVAANCEPCLRYHVNEAEKLGVSPDDMAAAVDLAQRVKDAPHQSILRLATRLIPVAQPEAAGCCGGGGGEDSGGGCCGGNEAEAEGGCCGGGDAAAPAAGKRCCG